MKINGENVAAFCGTVWDYLEQHNYQMERVAVEYNGEILQRAQYQSVILQPDDVLEIVSFVLNYAGCILQISSIQKGTEKENTPGGVPHSVLCKYKLHYKPIYCFYNNEKSLNCQAFFFLIKLL